jgi:hypothetical protein
MQKLGLPRYWLRFIAWADEERLGALAYIDDVRYKTIICNQLPP